MKVAYFYVQRPLPVQRRRGTGGFFNLKRRTGRYWIFPEQIDKTLSYFGGGQMIGKLWPGGVMSEVNKGFHRWTAAEITSGIMLMYLQVLAVLLLGNICRITSDGPPPIDLHDVNSPWHEGHCPDRQIQKKHVSLDKMQTLLKTYNRILWSMIASHAELIFNYTKLER